MTNEDLFPSVWIKEADEKGYTYRKMGKSYVLSQEEYRAFLRREVENDDK